MEGPATSRRTFLKASAACGIGALGAGFLAGCGGGGQQADSGGATGAAMLEDIAWDGAFDVVVVGLGAAGASAAIAAAESGASVLVVDKAPEGSEGGNSRYNSQLFASATNKDEALAYVGALAGGYYVPADVLDAYAQGLCDVRDTLVAWGLDEGELLDVTDVTEADIDALSAQGGE